MTVHAIGTYRVQDNVLAAVREASAATGADFSYMMAKAARESSFRADARASTSSATGLYQFIDQTWLHTVQRHGAKHGMATEARQIEIRDGRAVVDDPDARRAILALRTDPRLNALMAGEFANDNREHLERTVGGRIGPTELYLAHFLGASGASDFLREMRANPDRPAAQVFPAAAEANRTVFYHSQNSRPKTLSQVYDWIDLRVRQDLRLAAEAPVDRGDGFWQMDRARQASRAAAVTEANFAPGSGFALAGGRRAEAADLAFPTVAGLGDGELPLGVGQPLDTKGERQLSLWAVLTLSSLPVPGVESQMGTLTGEEAAVLGRRTA